MKRHKAIFKVRMLKAALAVFGLWCCGYFCGEDANQTIISGSNAALHFVVDRDSMVYDVASYNHTISLLSRGLDH